MSLTLGIYDPAQLQGFDPDTWTGRRSLMAADLLREIDDRGDARLRDAFFERFVDHRGAYKRTYRHRFADFDQRVLDAHLDTAGAEQRIHVLDVSVSDGSTTLDLLETLQRGVTGGIVLTATDLDTYHLLLQEPQRGPRWRQRRVLVSEEGEIVQVIFPPFVFASQAQGRVDRLLHRRAARRVAFAYARRLIARWRAGAADVTATRLFVSNDAFRRLVEHDDNVQFERWNILHPWCGGTHHIVRAMNVLNPSYFSLDEQRLAVAHLRSSVRPGGLLAVGSNQGPSSPVDGAIYRLMDESLVEVTSMGAGNRCAAAMEARR